MYSAVESSNLLLSQVVRAKEPKGIDELCDEAIRIDVSSEAEEVN